MKSKKNKSRIILFLFFLGIGIQLTYAQKNISIEATVLDQDTKDPLPFTNVIVENTSFGTVTNEDGIFELTVSSKYAASSVIFSFVGYENTSIPLEEFKDPRKKVLLKLASTPLDEIVMTVKNKYRELINESITKISSNYAQQSVYLDSYYREFTKIDTNYTKFSDAATTLYYAPYDGKYDSRKSKITYQRFDYLDAGKKNVPFPEPRDFIADERDQVKIKALRRSDNLQDFKSLEQSKKLKVIDTTDLKWLENNEIGGGPLRLTGADKIKRKLDFFDPKLNESYHYKLLKNSSYNNRPISVISFYPKDPKNLKAKYLGEITLDQESKAIIAYQYRLTKLSKKKLNQKFGTHLKTPESVYKKNKLRFIRRTIILNDYEVFVTYSLFEGKWYLKRIKAINNYENTGDLFEDYNATTESELIVNAVRKKDVQPFATPTIFNSIFTNALFQYDLPYDSLFWKSYNSLIATGVVGKALQDLESKSSLEAQFENKD